MPNRKRLTYRLEDMLSDEVSGLPPTTKLGSDLERLSRGLRLLGSRESICTFHCGGGGSRRTSHPIEDLAAFFDRHAIRR